MAASERGKVMHRIGDLIEQHADESSRPRSYTAVERNAYGPPTIRFAESEVDQARAAGVLIEFEHGAAIITDHSIYRELVKQALARTVEELHEFASRWLTRRAHDLRETTYNDYCWRLSRHLLPFFRDYRPSQIDIDLVDSYREHKLIERDEIAHIQRAGVVLHDRQGKPQRPLSNESINKTLALLAAVLDDAVERAWLPSNPARGRRDASRRPAHTEPSSNPTSLRRSSRPPESWRRRREAIMQADLEAARLRTRANRYSRCQPPTGIRQVNMTPLLHEILLDYRTRLGSVESDEPVFRPARASTETKTTFGTVCSPAA